MLLQLGCAFAAVVPLGDDNFTAFIEQHSHVLVKFYAPWCGHCKALAPKWEELSTFSDIPVAEVDCTASQKICGMYGIRGYPGIKLVQKNTSFDYDGQRDAKEIDEWAHAMQRPMFTVQKLSELPTNLTSSQIIVFDDPAKVAEWEEILGSYKGKLDIRYVAATEPRLVARRGGVEIVSHNMSPGASRMFVETNKVGFFPDIREDFSAMVARPGRQLIVVCLSGEHNEQIVREYTELDKRNALGEDDTLKKYTLARADVKDLQQFCDQFEKPEGDVPFIVFYQGRNEQSRKYAKVLIDDSRNATEVLKQAVGDFAAGRLKKAYIKSGEREEKKERGGAGGGSSDRIISEIKKYIDEKVGHLVTRKELEELLRE